MTPQLMSPRLPGVTVLAQDTTGPQYSRWRREVERAFTAKGTWGHCDGTQPMPMPESGPSFFSPSTSSNPQPELLEERRSWVKKDRDVKMDIFLSVADDIKVEVFEVGPPLPPSAMTAKDMIEALDERYGRFVFEDYHHVFCHFLNMHIDQFPNITEFNEEFSATLEDLLDHGHPLNDFQASSAYFSKLRCTQNPWVATKLKEWDTLKPVPKLEDLMKECPPWTVPTIRPLSMKPSRTSVPDEDLMGPPSIREEEEGDFSETDKSGSSTSGSSSPSHSRKSSRNSLNQTAGPPSTQSQEPAISHSRTFSEKSQEITVGASIEDLPSLAAFPLPRSDITLPAPPPINRPLPPLPSEQPRTRSNSPKARSSTPEPGTRNEKKRSEPKFTLTPPRPKSPQVFKEIPPRTSSRNIKRPSSSHSPSKSSSTSTSLTPDLQRRPSSSRGPSATDRDMLATSQSTPHLRRFDSTDSSIISLPLQGATLISEPPRPLQQSTTNIGLGIAATATEHSRTSSAEYGFGSSPPRSLMSRLSAELNDDEKRRRKRSWSLKARLSGRRLEVKEMI